MAFKIWLWPFFIMPEVISCLTILMEQISSTFKREVWVSKIWLWPILFLPDVINDLPILISLVASTFRKGTRVTKIWLWPQSIKRTQSRPFSSPYITREKGINSLYQPTLALRSPKGVVRPGRWRRIEAIDSASTAITLDSPWKTPTDCSFSRIRQCLVFRQRLRSPFHELCRVDYARIV